MTPRLFGSAIAVAVLTTASTAWAAACFTPVEAKAESVRRLQIELMVAALQCEGRTDLDLASDYNAFVAKFANHLADSAKVMRGYFARAYGNGNGPHFDAYTTHLANQASMRAMSVADYCDQAKPLFVAALAQEDLGTYASATLVGTDTCADKTKPKTTTTARK